MGLFDAIKNNSSGSTDTDIWNTVTEPTQFNDVLEQSHQRPQLVYKHSHRCSVCFVAKGNLEKAAADLQDHADMHFLNVVHNREASNHIASQLDVRHESPQAILIDKGEVILHASHGSIDGDKILKALES